MPILGTIDSQKSGHLFTAGVFDSIATATVTTSTTVAFTDIPQNYTHLQIRWQARNNAAVTTADVRMKMNGNPGVTYTYVYTNGSGTITGSAIGSDSAVILGRSTGASSTATYFGAGIYDLFDYTNTTTFKSSFGINTDNQNTFGNHFYNGSTFLSTSAITSLTITSEGSDLFVSGSTFALYGIKGA